MNTIGNVFALKGQQYASIEQRPMKYAGNEKARHKPKLQTIEEL